MAQVDSLQHQSNQEMEDMAARLEAEKQKLFEQNDPMLQLNLNKQKNVPLQTGLQTKHSEQELHHKDYVILDLRKVKMGPSHKLVKATNQLTNNKVEFSQSDQPWQTKYKALQEKFSKLEDKEQSWKMSVE